MDDGVTCPHKVLDTLWLQTVALGHLNVFEFRFVRVCCDLLLDGLPAQADHGDRRMGGSQHLGDIGADEPSATGHNNFSNH